MLTCFRSYNIFLFLGEIVVTDTDNQSVKIISANGQQIYKLDSQFSCPVGVAVDSNDNVIVSDWNDNISVSLKFCQYLNICCLRLRLKFVTNYVILRKKKVLPQIASQLRYLKKIEL